jgi:hypothetical protein
MPVQKPPVWSLKYWSLKIQEGYTSYIGKQRPIGSSKVLEEPPSDSEGVRPAVTQEEPSSDSEGVRPAVTQEEPSSDSEGVRPAVTQEEPSPESEESPPSDTQEKSPSQEMAIFSGVKREVK